MVKRPRLSGRRVRPGSRGGPDGFIGCCRPAMVSVRPRPIRAGSGLAINGARSDTPPDVESLGDGDGELGGTLYRRGTRCQHGYVDNSGSRHTEALEGGAASRVPWGIGVGTGPPSRDRAIVCAGPRTWTTYP